MSRSLATPMNTPPPRRCGAPRRDGQPCQLAPGPQHDRCPHHRPAEFPKATSLLDALRPDREFKRRLNALVALAELQYGIHPAAMDPMEPSPEAAPMALLDVDLRE